MVLVTSVAPSESIVDGSNIFTLMTREAMEFASESINASIFLSSDTFTNLFEVVPDSFRRGNVLHLMILLGSYVICDEHLDLSI